MTRILVIGGGIGGLTAALALHAKGFEVTVFEAVSAIRPLGVGINLLPHGAGVLHGLGLADRLDQTGVRTRAIEYRTRYGHLIASDPRGIEAGFEHPQYSIHRGHLQMLLQEAVRDRLGPDALRAGMRLQEFEQDAAGVTAIFRTADDATHLAKGELLVGADGFHSRVRRTLHPNEGLAHAEGMMMYRGAVERDPFGDGRTMFIAGNHDVKFVCYPISEEARQRGRALVNWVAEVRHDRPRPATEADWIDRGDRGFIDAFRDFRMPDIDIMALMEATETILEYPMIDRDPLLSWGEGRVTLLGDAAHPMYPIGANGASQAVVDGGALAAHLAGAQSIIEGLAAYEADRRPKTSAVVLANRQAGPEQVLDIADARITGPDDLIEDLIAPHEVEAVASRYRQIAGFTRRAE